jgi:hypothetical protein
MTARYPAADLKVQAYHRDASTTPGGGGGRTGWYGELLVRKPVPRRPGQTLFHHLAFCPHAHRTPGAAIRCAQENLLPARRKATRK